MHKRISKYLLIITALIPTICWAQYPSAKGDFEVDQIRGCNDLLISVNKIDPTPGVVIYFYEGFGSGQSSSNMHNYTTPGNFWLYQIIQAGTGDKVDSIMIEVLPPVVPSFELQSCNNSEVQLVINNTDYDIYEIDYGDGSPLVLIPPNTNPPSYTFAGLGPYTVMVTGLYTTANNRCGTSSIVFDPVAAVLPGTIHTLSALNISSLRIDYTLAANSLSFLEIAIANNSNYQTFSGLPQGTSLDTLLNLNLATGVFCFRIATYDACSNFRSYSNEICSISLQSSATNNQIDLNWNTFTVDPVNEQIELIRNNLPLATLPTNTNSFIDSLVVCESLYCYQTQVSYANGSTSTSLISCETAISNDIPETPTEISSVVNGDQINWSWQSDSTNAGYTYIYTIDQAGKTSLADSTVSNTYSSTVNPSSDNCITLQKINQCGFLSSLSDKACPITLSATSYASGNVVLVWSEQIGWSSPPLDYVVVIRNEDMSLRDSIPVGNALNYTDMFQDAPEQSAYYVVYAISGNPDISPSRSQQIYITREPRISIPNTFTPNADGLNDNFQITGKFIASVEIEIFNRWGNSIFDTSAPEGWDGSVKNGKAPLGNYTYRVTVKDFVGENHIRTGSILILSN